MSEAGKHTRHRALRVALRRWRLWWRYQLRALQWRILVRHLPRPSLGDLPRNPVVLLIGRLAGRGYLAVARTRERVRIARARVPDRVEPARTSFALINLQRSFFLGLAILIVAGLGVDELIHVGWGPTLGRLEIGHWLRSHLTKPSSETLRNLLAAAAAGTATILGLVISISLITWQATADRYRSSSIVAFLLRERLGAAVVRLLALGFAYSLWVLALLEVLGFPPYASAALALLLSTAAVLSLISYRQLGLLGYLPRNIASSLRQEVVREVLRAQRKGAGRSVENYSRQVVEADLQIFRDLLVRLRGDNEFLDVSACLGELGAVMSMYIQLKNRFRPNSLFFVHRKERLGPSGYAIEETIGVQGLMTPTTDVPDHLWFERRALDVVDLAVTPPLLANTDVAVALIRLWATALQYAWYREDPDAVELILARIESAASQPELRSTSGVAEELLTIPWVMVEMAGTGFTVDAGAIVARKPWGDEARVRCLPWKAQEDARELARRIHTEVVVAGSVVTPEAEMVHEVEKVRQPRLSELQRRIIDRAAALMRTQLMSAVDEKSREAVVIAQMTIRTLLRIVHYDLELPDLAGLARGLIASTGLADQQQIEDLQDASGRAARVLAEQQRWTAAYELLHVAEVAGLVARSQASDQQRQLRLFFDGLFTAALVYGWGEFHGRSDHVRAVGPYVQQPYADLDLLADAAAKHQLTGLMFPTVVHYQWAQPLSMAANALEDRPVFDGGIGYSLEKDHPSDLFARSHALGVGPMDCLEHLVAAVIADRDAARRALLSVIASLIDKRGQP
jgi:Predicted membrane protein (DUF2254)